MARKRSPGRKPYGYYKDERKVIEIIIRKRRKRRGAFGPTAYNAIAGELNYEGYRTRDGKFWRAQQVRKILSETDGILLANKRPKKTQLSRSDYLTPKQIADCRAVFKDEHEEIIFETLLGSALRASELCALRVRDLSLDAEPYEIQVIRGKGCKQRSVIIGPKLAERLRRHLKKRNFGKTTPLFLNRRYLPLSYRDVYYLIKAIGKRAQILSLHPHTLRHTWATLCDYETACFDIAYQLGHSKLDTTAIYRKVRSQQRMRTAASVEQIVDEATQKHGLKENISNQVKTA